MKKLILAVAAGLCVAAAQAGNAVVPSVRVGLALSGGAALGFAHIGVLKVLEREGIPVVAISGNSMGSMVGGMYAAGYSAAEIESLATNADWGSLFSSGVPFGARYLPERQQAQRYVLQFRHRNLFPSLPSGLVPLQNVEFLLMSLLSRIEYNTGYDLDSLPIPYRAVSVDLISGRRVVFRSGRLDQAIRASIAIPGVFAPEKLDGQELVDGGVQQYLPVDPLREFNLDMVIAVLTMKHNAESSVSLIDIASRSMDVVSIEDLARQKALADVLIEPNVDPFTHSDFARAKELITAGESAAVAALPEIRAKLKGVPVSQRNAVRTRLMPIVRSIGFEGLHTTRVGTIRPEVKTRPGERLRFDHLLDDMVRLFHTGLFEGVNYRLEPWLGDSTDVVFELSERAYGFYSVGIRYDSDDDVAVGAEIGQGNLFGSGAGIRAALDLGNPGEVRLGLTGTRLFRFPLGYRLDGFWGSIDRPYFDDSLLSINRTVYRGGVAEAGYILGRNAFFDFGLTGYNASYPAPRLAPVDTSNEWIVGPTFRFESNSYPDIDFPTRGADFTLDAIFSTPALRASRGFLKLDYASERVLPVARWLLVRPALLLGVTLPEPAWAEMFHTGGPDLVGFAHGEFTTAQRAVVRLGLDVRLFNLLGQEANPFYLQLVANGATFERWDRLVQRPDWEDILHWGAGVGLRTNTPLGPVQLVVGAGDFGKRAPYRGGRINAEFSVGREFRYTR